MATCPTLILGEEVDDAHVLHLPHLPPRQSSPGTRHDEVLRVKPVQLCVPGGCLGTLHIISR